MYEKHCLRGGFVQDGWMEQTALTLQTKSRDQRGRLVGTLSSHAVSCTCSTGNSEVIFPTFWLLQNINPVLRPVTKMVWTKLWTQNSCY